MEHKSEIIPFFPLSVLLFPGEDIPLRIFEPRYKQLIEEVRTSGNTFVIPFVLERQIQEYGCEVRLNDVVAENPRGRMVITVESLCIVEIISYRRQLDGKLYAGGTIRRIPGDDPIESAELREMVRTYVEQFDSEFLNSCKSPEITHQDIIRALNLSSDEKFKFVCMENTGKKEGYLAGQLRYLAMIRNQETLLGNDFGLN